MKCLEVVSVRNPIAPNFTKFTNFAKPFPDRLLQLVAVSAIGLFLCASIKHGLFKSTAYDLGYFDQAAYLISQGKPPIVSFWGHHFLGGHGDWILYPIALLYKIVPSVQWLFAVQALALASGQVGAWLLAVQAGLKGFEVWAIVFAYGLYPLVFNINLFDFHPGVIALPLFLVAVWAARADRLWTYGFCLMVILGCRDVLSITVAAMGLWLWFFEHRRRAGAIAFLWGTGSLWLVIQRVIPTIPPGGVLKLNLGLGQIFTIETIGYFALLLLPMFWMLRLRFLAPMLVAIPTILMNVLSIMPEQRDLLHQYSVPILPFLVISGVACLAAGEPILLKRPKWIILWSLFGFLCLTKYSYFSSRFLEHQDNAASVYQAIAQVPRTAQVLTTENIAPHLTHRSVLHITDVGMMNRMKNTAYSHILLNMRHPGVSSNPRELQVLLRRLKDDRSLDLQMMQDDVYLFVKR
jgi:uncharacterized membrane protein